MKLISKKNILFWLLFLLICFHFFNNIAWLIKDPLATGKDSYAHLTSFLNFKQIISDGKTHPFYDQNKSLFYNLVFGVIDYPPFFNFFVFLLDFLFGHFYANAAIFTSTLAFLMLIFLVYKIGEVIEPKTGLLAAFICSFYPMMYYISRHFNIEMTLAAVVCAAVLCLLKTEFFEKRGFSIGLGVMFGIGMLTKETFIVYLVGPLCVTIYFSFNKAERLFWKKRSVNLLLAFLCAFFISLIFYYNKGVYANLFNRSQFIGAVNNSNVFSFEQLIYYPSSFRFTVGVFLSCVFCYALIFLSKIDRYIRGCLLSWIIFPILFLSLFVLKYAEYMIALLPALALVTAFGLLKLKNKKNRALAIIGMIIISFLNYYNYGRPRFFYDVRHCDEYSLYSFDGKKDKSKFDSNLFVIIESLGRQAGTVGVFYNHRNQSFNHFFLKRLFAYSDKKAKLVDALPYPVIFFKNLDVFDKLIFVSDSEKPWLDEQGILEYKQQVNRCNYTKFKIISAKPGKLPYGDINTSCIPEKLVKKLFDLKEKYQLEHVLEFLDLGKSWYAYFYRRIY
ncbi:MAG: glycosyltransferase family 39 protein [Candidatus Omnitrophica bacterium]|nr:glycosyltransferase family 39 protein [Candidatus Omnitrophota bacterium]